MKLYFIRHGETDYNRQRKFYGTTDVSINRTGETQAEQLHQKLAQTDIDEVLVSRRLRTHQTAQIIFPDYHFKQADFLDEWGFGAWEGMDADQIQAKYPVEWEAWLADTFGYTPPEAEPYAQYHDGVVSGFKQFVGTNSSKRIALVTHLGTIRVILNSLFPEKAFFDIKLAQGNYTCLTFDGQQFSIEQWDK